MAYASGSTSENVINMDEVRVNELIYELFRNKVLALARVPIDPISKQRIKKLAAKFVVLNPHRVLSDKVDEQTTSAPQPLMSTLWR